MPDLFAMADWVRPGREHTQIVEAGRAWQYVARSYCSEYGCPSGPWAKYTSGASPLGQQITGLVAWPPTAEVYARTSPNGEMVLVAYGHGTEPGQRGRSGTQGINHAAPSVEEAQAWVINQGWGAALDTLLETTAASTEEQRIAADESFRGSTGGTLDHLEIWMKRRYREGRDYVTDAAGSAGGFLKTVSWGLALFWVLDRVFPRRR